ncbi:MAG TPA: DUF6531 domain-containing protein [Capsulimonadaceae bacterium]|nr:DUF6531 domain-containing protein [Capsulimonadaceae bacterium]
MPLTVTGQYTLAVNAQYGTSTGPYTITLTTTPPSTVPSTPSKVESCPNVVAFICPTCAKLAQAAADAASGGSPGVNPVNPSGNPISQFFGYVLQAFGFQSGNMAGNPINFDTGYKQQVETDYSAGGLIFTRFYRSDSTWTSNTIGSLWRHNFARTFSVSGSAASVTDGTGTTVAFTLTGSTWVPNDPSTTSTLAAITGGYAYTLADGTVEFYNSSNQLYRITYLGGGALNLSYNGSGQLTTIANENSRQLSLTYDTSGRVSTLVTPDGTFTYGYDTHSNLQTDDVPPESVHDRT